MSVKTERFLTIKLAFDPVGTAVESKNDEDLQKLVTPSVESANLWERLELNVIIHCKFCIDRHEKVDAAHFRLQRGYTAPARWWGNLQQSGHPLE